MASMDDLIAMAGQLHMSQETLDLNSFKAQLARTLVLPMPIPSSSSASSPASDASQPLPSPVGSYNYDSFPFDQGSNYSPSPSPSPAYPASYEDEASLAAAFAGDAFAPMVAPAQAKANPWASFQPPPQYQQHSFQFQLPQEKLQMQMQPRQDSDAMDADMAEAML